MRNKAKILLLYLLVGLTVAHFASAALVNCGGYNDSGTLQKECSLNDLIATIRLIINYLLSWAWLVSVLSIVWQGIRMVTARGNEETLSKAKDGLEWSLYGFMLILISFVVLNVLIGLITGGGQLNPNALDDSFHLLK